MPHQGISAPQELRITRHFSAMELAAHFVQGQLQNPYRRHQRAACPAALTPAQTNIIYASETDLLNVALFGLTAAHWRQDNPDQSGNMRNAATLEQLVVLSNLESINAVFIHQGLDSKDRLKQLNAIAITQMRSLIGLNAMHQLANLAPRRRSPNDRSYHHLPQLQNIWLTDCLAFAQA